MLTDYHIHVEKGQYTVEWLRKFYEHARHVGINDWGISEHAYRFIETKHIFWNHWVEQRQTEKMDDYLNMILQARAEGINVKFGIEIDYFPGKEKEIKEFIDGYPFDYVIGSVHWIDQWGIDLSEMKEEWERRKVEDVWRDYFDRVESLIESRLFDIAAHLDLAKIFKYIPTNQDFLQEQYDRIARAFANSGTCIEISTAGLRKPVGEMYPQPLLLKTCFLNGVPIVINSDAHNPEDVGADYDQALTLARGTGYRSIQTFTARKAESHTLG
ncbi:histidinol-phosphatase [Desulfotomaculum sp. 1211_IL3151]|uniref:histidinol-phosphatase n=1 Tax=Desulfotomaculum sp. 1211_IL3151 TaxID=3084055 RepID=UPI002FD9C862